VTDTELWIRERVEVDESGCWLWRLAKTRNGYGRAKLEQRAYMAHRLAYVARHGSIPPGLHIDHLCRVRHCVNPDHLEAVTCQVNTLRGETLPAANARKTHCPKGHEYTPANTRYGHKRKRACRTCDRLRMQVRYWALRAPATPEQP